MKVDRGPIEWAFLPLKRFAQFSGRSSRAEYWWFALAYFLAGFIVDAVDLALGSEIGLLGLLFTFGLIIPMIAVTARRLHDTNRSGWWFAAPIIPAAIFGFLATQAKLANTFDTSRPTTSTLVPLFAFVFACLVVTIFMILPGTKARNRYGPDPYGTGAEALA